MSSRNMIPSKLLTNVHSGSSLKDDEIAVSDST